jgi:hypothetical protein
MQVTAGTLHWTRNVEVSVQFRVFGATCLIAPSVPLLSWGLGKLPEGGWMLLLLQDVMCVFIGRQGTTDGSRALLCSECPSLQRGLPVGHVVNHSLEGLEQKGQPVIMGPGAACLLEVGLPWAENAGVSDGTTTVLCTVLHLGLPWSLWLARKTTQDLGLNSFRFLFFMLANHPDILA